MVVEVSGEVLAVAGVDGEEDLVVGEVGVETPTSGQETGLARTQGKGGICYSSNFFPSCWFYCRVEFKSFCSFSILTKRKG